MKKFTALFLSILMIFTVFSLSVSAVSITAGDDALRNQFKSGSGGGLSYEYFAPEVKEGVKYPVVIWLHGIASGNYDGDQVDSYDFCKWASDEYQARFVNAGGAYLICPRANGTWDLTTTSAVKNCVDSFISKHADSVDKDRIYLIGFSLGGSMSIKVASAYNNYFAAVVPMCAVDQSAAGGIKNMAVWFFANDKDTYASANSSATRSSFNKVAANASDKSKIRFTYVSNAVTPTGGSVGMQHYMWRILTNDMFMADGSQYAYSTTKDGTGATINFQYPDGIINWLSQQTKQEQGSTSESPSFWDKLVAFFRAIGEFFARLFG